MTGLLESIEKAITKLYRKRIAARVFAQLGHTVKYGPFKGLAFERTSHLSNSDLVLKALGLYETEITARMLDMPGITTLVNLGAGDGYFPIALLRSGKVLRAIGFEMIEEGRKAIAANASLNGVADSLVIHGAAGAGLLDTLKADGCDPQKLIFLCDIEGAEFSVIDDALAQWLAPSHVIVELHPFAVANGAVKEAELVARLTRTHLVEIIKATPRDWVGIPEVEALHDLERALVTTEGRKLLARWLLATPKA